MINENAFMGGEISGHLYFRDMYGADDAIFATLKVAQLLSESDEKFSTLVDSLPKYFTRRKVYDIPEGIKFAAIAKLQEKFVREGYNTLTIDGVRVDLDDGWFIIRASNTLPQIKTTTEARNQRSLDRIENLAVNSLTEAVNLVRGHPIDESLSYKTVSIT
jgi:phosphomannomutase